MGKLKFTFTNIWFFVALVLVCFLTENSTHLQSDLTIGFDIPTLIILSLATVGALVMFYFANHKENKIKADWVLLPAISIIGIAFILGIWLNKGQTYPFANGEGSIEVTFTIYERIRATVILVIFLAFMYAMVFMVNVNNPRSRRFYWLSYVAIAVAAFSLVFSLISEWQEYKSIFTSEDPSVIASISIASFYGNKNYYGGILFVGFLSCIIANYYKPRLYLYLLMVIFFVATLASASMLPTIISAFAIIIYLFEEIIRFAFKKRWIKSGFATFALFTIIALIIVMYIGCAKEWDGFNGLNNYVGDLLKKKDFSTLTGRIELWKSLSPYFFDSDIHTWFGRGFMISEKSILAITGAMNNAVTSGVRTTHNGLIQVLFEYGVIGLIIHAILLVYFGYACIRLLLEKRFHFVFVYFFVALCFGVYNMCESSALFNRGVKEIYATFIFIMPIISECKFCLHFEKVQELKEIPLEKKKMDTVKLGQVVSFIIMSIIVGIATTFVCQYSYSQEWLKYLLINLFVGFSILLIFVPYLISFYYKYNEPIVFIAHTLLNFALIALATYISYMAFKNNDATKDLAIFLTPVVLFTLLLLDSLVYSLIKKGGFRQWRLIFVNGSFSYSLFAIAGGLLTGILSFVIIQSITEMNIYLYIVCLIQSFIGYFVMFYFMPTKGGREFLNEWNEQRLFSFKQLTIKDEKYYG